MGKIFSPGKLLLTSEYVVLDGAQALALPTKWGQEFFEEQEDGKHLIFWEAYHQNQPWLKVTIDYRNWTILDYNIKESAEFILKVLEHVAKLSETQLKSSSSYHLKTNLQFPANYGLGSSSTLMNNLAEWAGIDAFHLNEVSLGGSGYDIAVAKEKSAILFQKANDANSIEKIDFNPSFKDELVFIHLNQKQDSREGIRLYRSKPKDEGLIEAFTQLTQDVLKADNIRAFSELMIQHENLISNHIGIPKVKDIFFENYPGFVKSLGAWGGDFVMASKESDYKSYFENKNFPKTYRYSDLINLQRVSCFFR